MSELAGRLIMGGLPGPTLDAESERLLRDGKMGAVCLFLRNVDSPAQVRALCDAVRAAAGQPVLVAADLEGGYVWRLRPPAVHWPSAMALGAARQPDLTRRVARALGTEMRAHGIDVNLAPVVDVNNNPANPVIATRSFGEDPANVAEHGAAFVRGLHDARAAACVKHFPGHGDTQLDSHLALPSIPHDLDRLRRVELPPFVAAIEAGVDAVMTAHVVFAALDADVPATLSRRILTGLLREELDFQGVIVSDAMGMRAIADRWGTAQGSVMSLAAGADVVCVVDSPAQVEEVHAAVAEAIADGTIPQQQARAAAGRLSALEARLASGPRPELSVVGSANHVPVAVEATGAAMTLVRDDGVLPLRAGERTAVIECYSGPATRAEDRRGLHGRLAEAVLVRGAEVESLLVDVGEVGAALPAAERLAAGTDALVLATRNAWRSDSQRDFVRRVCAAAKRSALVALRDPYDLARAPEAGALLAAYCDVPAAIEAAADVLFGAEARGKLPVTLPAADALQSRD